MRRFQDKGGIFGVHKEDWNALTEYHAMTQELAGSEAAKEMLQEYGAKEQEKGLAVDPANYEKIYTCSTFPTAKPHLHSLQARAAYTHRAKP